MVTQSLNPPTSHEQLDPAAHHPRARWAARARGALAILLGLRLAAVFFAGTPLPFEVRLAHAQSASDALLGTEIMPTPAALAENALVPPSSPKPLNEPPSLRPADRPPVKTVTEVVYLTDNRPGWLEMPRTYEGKTLQVAVRAGPYSTVRACEPDLAHEIDQVAAEFIAEHLQSSMAPMLLSYSLRDLQERKVVREQFAEQLSTSVGLMNQVHALLVFDSEFCDEIEERWAEIRGRSRLAQTGLAAGVVLLLVGTVFSFLKLDTATRGFHTRRLQLGAAVTIVVLVATSVLLTKWIPWL